MPAAGRQGLDEPLGEAEITPERRQVGQITQYKPGNRPDVAAGGKRSLTTQGAGSKLLGWTPTVITTQTGMIGATSTTYGRKMRSLLAIVALFVASTIYAAGVGVHVGGNPGVSVSVNPTCFGGNCGFAAAPWYIYQPRVYYQPYQYQGTVVSEMRYPTPLRNWFFGRSRSYHYYTPAR